MKIFNINKGVMGSKVAYENIIKTKIPEEKQDQIKHRLKVLDHANKYGIKSAIGAFEVSERTIKYWRAKLRNSNGVIKELASKSTRPLNTRKRSFGIKIINYVKEVKLSHPKLGKDKISILLKQDLNEEVSPVSVFNIIKDLKQRGELQDRVKVRFGVKTGKMTIIKPFKRKTKLRIKDYKPDAPGDLIQLDTVVIFVNGKRYYTLTRLAFAYISTSHTSINAERFLKRLNTLFGYEIKRVQTDNGSEFHKCFDEACSKLNIVHYFNYPHSPKMNAYIERFNRTIQEEFLNRHKNLFLIQDLETINKHLNNYLDFYNNKRPHWGLHLNNPRCYTNSILGVQNVS
jgi:transposase InsO family protein